MIILISSIFSLSVFLIFLLKKYQTLCKIEFVQISNSRNKKTLNPQKPNILVICSEIGFGGREVATINLYNNLIENGFKTSILVSQNSGMQQQLKNLKIAHYSIFSKRIFKKQRFWGLTKNILKVCNENDINIIHCNSWKEIIAAKKAGKKLNIPVLLSQHDFSRIRPKYLKNLAAVFAGSKPIKELIKQRVKNIKIVEFLPPFFNAQPFLNFDKSLSLSKEDFFKKHFDIELEPNIPFAVCIANVAKNKNQTILLKAMQKLIYKNNKPLQIIFVGNNKGEYFEECQKLVSALKLEKFAYFVGFSSLTAEILFYSDFKILPSKQEAFGIVLLEAALMKKASIGATTTGAENVILNNQTGLLFENDNANDLANKIKLFLDNKELVAKFGENAYKLVSENYLPSITIKKLEHSYNQIIQK
ncbi:TPA: hypothetical protein DEO28_03130 [Candidatus Dependentiae bacterium]|nr:MAG: Glycosyl transferase, group 1 family protein [candidate division TM6 bacterium GW2011_GWE2_31_21]KKP53100.1 MAG: Glycosyl transferase, group 1 family protein [candidate division TM6 bacterium GW2011_GWF2_33_332]HBS47918.1 hypothetical protein [Candidatus Dependentiae bacterium]HBZ73478.1 hypothetical protein [Candidatus Dependentiae bacterium]